MRQEFHIPIKEQGVLATEQLSQASGLSVTRIKTAMHKGAVWISDSLGVRRIRRIKKTLAVGATLHLYYDDAVLNTDITAPSLVADEEKFSVWYKPPGVLSQGSKWGDHCTLGRWVEVHDKGQRPVFTVHRLDRAASGLMLLAHGKSVARALSGLFESRSVDKEYQAIVKGAFPKLGTRIEFDSAIDGRSALSSAQLLDFDAEANCSLLSVVIETGRKHQIRRHLGEAGFPIVGDHLYGATRVGDLQLCAVSLKFNCPITGGVKHYQLSADYQLQWRLSSTQNSQGSSGADNPA